MSRIFVIHENEEWFPPLREALDACGLDYGDLFMGEGGPSSTSRLRRSAVFITTG